MAHSFFNLYTLTLSAPPPTLGRTLTAFNSHTYIQGNTKVSIDYNILNFVIPAYKVSYVWDYTGDITNYTVSTNYNPLSTVTPYTSAASSHVFVPTTASTSTSSSFTIYYENGMTYLFTAEIIVLADNIIDFDLNLIDGQLSKEGQASVMNILSIPKNVMFNNINYS